MRLSIKKIMNSLLILVMTGFLMSCNNDNCDEPCAAGEIKGTAATGEPIVGTVTLIDANGESTGSIAINPDGTFTIDTEGYQPPFILEAEPAAGSSYYSYADSSNVVVNITPLTTLAMYMATRQDPATLFESWKDSSNQVNMQALLEAAQSIYVNLQAFYDDNGVAVESFNFFNTAFAADGTGIDGVLDDLDISIDYEAVGPLAISISSGSGSVPFIINIDLGDTFDGIDIGGSTGGDSGGGDSGGGDSGGGDIGGGSGDWTLTISGALVPDIVITGLPAAPTSSQEVENAVISQAGNDITNFSFTTETDTPTLKVFDVSYSITIENPLGGGDIVTPVNLTYTYSRD